MLLLQMKFTENKKFAHITQKVKNTAYEPRFVQPKILIFYPLYYFNINAKKFKLFKI